MSKTDSPLFSNFCSLLQGVLTQRGTQEKKRRVARYLYEWRAKYDGDFYEALRLLLPQLDKTRYGLKEAKLARLYIDALGLARTSEDAYNLLKWKLPSNTSSGKSAGDFAAVAYEAIQSRSTVLQPTQTVHDVNVFLDGLAMSESNEKKKADMIKHLLNVYTAFEQKWLIRIILKDLKIGMSENSVFDVYHPDARNLYAVCSDLRTVVRELKNPTTRVGKSTIQLFHPFKPQLGHREIPKDVRKVLCNGRFYIEEKIDGERMQMHYNGETKEFKWFTRNSTNYTDLYGDSPNSGKLADMVAGSLNAKSLILDGEMVSYDPKLDVFLPFGTLKSAAKDDNTWDPHRARPCFVVFDVVFCNGIPLLNHPLEERLAILNAVVTENRGHIHLLPRQEKSTFNDIVEALDNVITLRQEGLLIKNPGSTYDPGARNHSWIKLKPEYFDSLHENCDLLVIGGCYGAGRRGNLLSQFLCALRDDRVPEDQGPKFMTFTMIGTGYTMSELEEFRKLFQNFKPYDPKNQPSWLIHPQKSDENPDVIVDYTESIVVEVKASEIIWGNMFGAGSTLRFPRFMKFRPDKSWQDTMTYTEMVTARREGRFGANKRTAPSQADFMQQRKKRIVAKSSKSRRGSSILPSQQGIDTELIERKSQLFDKISFYIISGDDLYSKSALEQMVTENGGDFCQTAKSADMIIAGKKNVIVDSIIHQKKKDVIQPRWLVDCVENRDLLPLAPSYMVYTSQETKEHFQEEMDDWGDSYTKDATEKSLHETLPRIPVKYDTLDPVLPLMNQIEAHYFPHTGIPGMMFSRIKALILVPLTESPMNTSADVLQRRIQDDLKVTSCDIRFRDGRVVYSLEKDITHVIVHEKDLSRLPEISVALQGQPQPRYVTRAWVEKCIANKTVVDERDFVPVLPQRTSESLVPE